MLNQFKCTSGLVEHTFSSTIWCSVQAMDSRTYAQTKTGS